MNKYQVVMLLVIIVSVIWLSGFLEQGEGISYTAVDHKNVDRRKSTSSCDSFMQNINYSSYCLHCALQRANSTNNIIINITTDVVLSSVMQLMNANNISIIGHNNPTVDCNNSGALNFMSCHNITIKGINWWSCQRQVH